MPVPKSLQTFPKICRPTKRPSEIRKVFYFGSFKLSERERVLLCDDEPVALKSKDFDVLLVLLNHKLQLVTKAQLLDAVWPNAFVDEANLGVHIAALRKALRHSTEQFYIQTVHKHGYRFVGEVKLVEELDYKSEGEFPIWLMRDKPEIAYATRRSSEGGKTSLTLPRGVRIEAYEGSFGSNITIAVPNNPNRKEIVESGLKNLISNDISVSSFDSDGVRYITVALLDARD